MSVLRGVLCMSFFFFFSSRRRHTRLQGDWSSDVCSSDLLRACGPPFRCGPHARRQRHEDVRYGSDGAVGQQPGAGFAGGRSLRAGAVAIDYGPPANAWSHRWRVNLPSLAGQLIEAGKDWRAYLQNIPESGTHLANWPGDNNDGKLYAVKHNPFPYVAEIQNDPKQFAKQVPLEQLFSDLGTRKVPELSYIVPDQCRDMHELGNPLAPCGGASDTDDNDVKRGDDETSWLVNAIMGSPVWHQGRNAIFVVFDEGNGPLAFPHYDPEQRAGTAPRSTPPAAGCYDPANFNDRVVLIAITNYGVKGVQDARFQSHYSLLKTIEAAFDLSYLGHAADQTTNTLAPLLAPTHRE